MGVSVASNATVYNWIAEFKLGHTSTSNARRSGRTNEETTPEMSEKIHNIVLDDPKVKLRELAAAVDISSECMFNILHKHLGMRKLTARWVLRLLTIDKKCERVRTSQYCLDMFRRKSKKFLRRYITVDETWIYHYTSESKQQSAQWVPKSGNAPKRPKTQRSAGKFLITVFWDAHGIILIDYLEKRRTITGEYYASLFDRLNDEIEKKGLI
ncbi:PREDICTED: histone-lysine N-methyltransferase SETMAR-like [Dinoponera quadriceps]|uniref:Histone-lysine N-methyltransferase SETMAR-like n=1 Tax=Dinoponera quadriceps TaxID=609295 RepID=A0A6P3YDX8_DINQU|nr:PREDICTED: histone-lysine N-methyltransferase SETMAR-like [Dinoponera quadriceps]